MKKSLVVLVFVMMFLVGGFSFVCGEGLLWSLDFASEIEDEELIMSVTLGDDGNGVFFQTGPVDGDYKLISSFDSGSLEPIFNIGADDYNIWSNVVSAKKDDVYVSHSQREVGGSLSVREGIVRKFTSSSNNPDWEHVIPGVIYDHKNSKVFMSDDGETIVTMAWNYDGSSFRNIFEVLNPDTGVPIIQIPDISLIWNYKGEAALSGDGSTFVVRNGFYTKIIDTATGNILFSDLIIKDSEEVHISYDGSLIFFGLESLTKLERQPNGDYLESSFINVGDLGYSQAQFVEMALSEDGSKLYYGLRFSDGSRQHKIGVYDIVNGQNLMEYTVIGVGQYSNTIDVISVSESGEIFAVGMWGDEFHSIPEVLIFDVNQNEPIGEYVQEGSVFGLEVSPDGTKVAVAVKAQHMSELGGGSYVNLYEIGEPDLTLTGVPRVGSTVRFEQPYLGGGQINRVLYSKVFSPSMTSFGWLYPFRQALFILPRGIDSGALTRTIFTIPDEVGEEYWFQGLSFNPRSLSENYIKMRVLPAAA
ncbi:MAG: WD40 repeat domain-containing protein [archaeon]